MQCIHYDSDININVVQEKCEWLLWHHENQLRTLAHGIVAVSQWQQHVNWVVKRGRNWELQALLQEQLIKLPHPLLVQMMMMTWIRLTASVSVE